MLCCGSCDSPLLTGMVASGDFGSCTGVSNRKEKGIEFHSEIVTGFVRSGIDELKNPAQICELR